MPSVFVSHGAPDLPLRESSVRTFLEGLGQQLPRPKALLVISPHWMTSLPTLSLSDQKRAIHDFGGFPSELYELAYEVDGWPEALSQALLAGVQQGGFRCAVDPERGLDHGAWVPLLLMYPQGDIPVAQLSLPAHFSPAQLLDLGVALRPLRAQGVMVLASGSATHNLWAFGGRSHDAPPPGWVTQFETWLIGAVERGDIDALLNFSHAPGAADNHPTPEHLLPLFVAIGAGDAEWRGQLLHQSTTYGILSMAAFRFG